MAEPLASSQGAAAVALLEEAAQLLRQTSFSTLLRHWTGSAPFAMGLLWFWNNLTTGRLSDSACAAQALALALLLAWMNCWRAVFAGRLLRQLTGAAEPRWSWSRLGRMAAVQISLGGLKLVLLPLAGLVGFPLAGAAAFFRNAAALADQEGLNSLQAIGKARELALVHPRQSWAILPVLALLQLVVTFNLALAIAVLPYLIRMLTGYESEFNRAQTFFLTSPLFLMLVLVSGWAAFDPFVQAVYCVRCFHGESVATGEDLRVGLRRIRGVKAAAVLLIAIQAAAVAPLRADDAVTPAQLHEAVGQAMQAPEYGWRIPPPPRGGLSGRPWALRVADKILEAMNSAWRAIGHGLKAVFEWIFGKLGSSPEAQGGSAPGAGLHWSLYLLIAAAACAGIWIARRRRLFRRGARQSAAAAGVTALRLEEEAVSADQLPDERWMEIALGCLRAGNYRLALRAYYLASLAWLGQRGFVSIHSGKTNREYETELRRKARQFGAARGLFGANVAAFEAVWYGMHDVSRESVAEFQARLEDMKREMA